MNSWEYMIDLHKQCQFSSRERTGKASNSELKRWLQNKAVELNGKRIEWNEEVTFPISSLVLFPKKNRVTIF